MNRSSCARATSPPFVALLLFLIGFAGSAAGSCVPNSELLKTKIETRRHEPHKPITNGVQLSLKLQRLHLSAPDELLVDGFLTKRFVDTALDYADENPCEEYAVVRIANTSAFKTPNIALMTGEWLSTERTEANAVVFPNGTVFETQRVAISAPCRLNATRAFGRLECKLVWHNMDFRQTEMFIVWTDDIDNNPSAADGGIQTNAGYRVKDLLFDHNVLRKPIGDFDELLFTVLLVKSQLREILLFYFPQLVFVAIAWLTMFLGPMAITRSVLIMGSMLLLLLHSNYYAAAHTKAAGAEFTSYDIWQIATLVFTFATLVELIIITCMASVGRSNRLRSCVSKKRESRYYTFEPLYEELNDLRNRKARQTCTFCSYSALAVDIVSLLSFAALFALFCIVYFSSTEKLVDSVNNLKLPFMEGVQADGRL